MPAHRVRSIATQLAEALQELSRAGIVHRDLKPENIRLGPNDAVTVLDLGVAGFPNWTTLTQNAAAIGTVAYMAPEQLDGKDASAAMDTWAFGVLLAELSGGRFPFPLTGVAQLVEAIRSGRADLSAVPAPWDEIARQCLTPKPGRRPKAQDLAKMLRGESIASGPGRKRKLVWALAGSAACVTVGAVALTAFPTTGQGRGPEPSETPSPPTDESSPIVIIPSQEPTTAPIEIALAPAQGDALLSEVARSSSAIRAMAAGQWVPQVSSKCAGLEKVDLIRADGSFGADGTKEPYPDGITEDKILKFHQALKVEFGSEILLIEGEAIPACTEPRMWVSLANLARPTKEEITDWCTTFDFPQGECLPRELSADAISAAAYRPFLLGDEATTYRIDVPFTMTGVQEASGATFSDDAAGATLTVNEYPTGGEAEPPSLDEAIRTMSEGAAEEPPNFPLDDGFMLSGYGSDGLIYYWRQYRSASMTVDLIWRYPESARDPYDDAVGKGVQFIGQ